MSHTHDNTFRGYLLKHLRRAHYTWPARAEAMKAARVSYGKYKCAHCGGVFARKDIAVDHIETVVPLSGFIDWDDLIARLFCKEDGLQVLCNTGTTSCHKVKTKAENKIRRDYVKGARVATKE